MGRTALFTAVNSSRYDSLARLLVQNGLDPNTRDREGRTVMHHIAKDKLWLMDSRRFDTLMAVGVDINARDNEGITPLHLALRVVEWQRDQINALLDKGADPHARDNRGQTPLDLAMEKNEAWLVDLLRKADQ
jgi:hypothetical protein